MTRTQSTLEKFGGAAGRSGSEDDPLKTLLDALGENDASAQSGATEAKQSYVQQLLERMRAAFDG
jgi:hypothetical protein